MNEYSKMLMEANDTLLNGVYLPQKGMRLVRLRIGNLRSIQHAPNRGFTIVAQESRIYSHHLTGMVHERTIGRGETFKDALNDATENMKKYRKRRGKG